MPKPKYPIKSKILRSNIWILNFEFDLKLGFCHLNFLYNTTVMKGKKILVTGAAGFVGANLVRKLISQKANVHVLLRKETDLWRIKECLAGLNIHLSDLSNLSYLRKLVKKIQPEITFHLAAHGGYPFQKDPESIIDANLTGTLNLLMAASDISYEAFINTGTSSEYGYKKQPMKETDFLEPASFYAAAKAGATLFAQTIAKLDDKPIVTLRLFSVYGPWEEPTRLIPTVIKQALANDVIATTGGKEARDFVYVNDVVDAYLMVAKKAKLLQGKIFNIGSGRQRAIYDVVRMIVKMTKSKSKIHKGKYETRPWDTNHWVADTSFTKKILGWEAKTSFENGLRETIEWQKISQITKIQETRNK